MSNDRAYTWLQSLGYSPQPEPDFIKKGKKPDFFCDGNSPLWVEVKTFEPPSHSQILDRAFSNLRDRCESLQTTGDLYVMVSTALDDRAEKWLIGHLKHRKIVENVENIITIPREAQYTASLDFQYQSREGIVNQTCLVALSDRYPFYPSLEPLNWSEEVVITHSDGRRETRQLYDILLDAEEPTLIARLFPSSAPITLHGAFNFGMSGNNTDQRIREAVKEANKQIKNGQEHRAAPGIVVIYHESLDFAGDQQVAAALVGDLLVPIEDGGHSLGEPIFSQNGAWRGKNSAVSAVTYIRSPESSITIINPWARYQISSDIFRSPVLTLDGFRFVRRN